MQHLPLLLDVGGVLDPSGKLHDPSGFTAHQVSPDEEPVLVDPAHGVLIDQLSDVFGMVWATVRLFDAIRAVAAVESVVGRKTTSRRYFPTRTRRAVTADQPRLPLAYRDQSIPASF